MNRNAAIAAAGTLAFATQLAAAGADPYATAAFLSVGPCCLLGGYAVSRARSSQGGRSVAWMAGAGVAVVGVAALGKMGAGPMGALLAPQLAGVAALRLVGWIPPFVAGVRWGRGVALA